MLNSKLHAYHWIYLLAHAIVLLFGFILIFIENVWVKSVGASLIAAAITGYVVFIYVLFSTSVIERLNILIHFGFLDAFEARSTRIKAEYDNRLAKATRQIDIMGFGLSTFRQDFGHRFDEMSHRASMRILLIDPEFPEPQLSYSIQRDREEKNQIGTIKSDVRKFISDYQYLLRASGNQRRFQIRLYRHLPSISYLRVDNDLFWGPYLMYEQSRNTPTFIVKRGGVLFDRFADHFETIWNDDTLSRSIPSSWLEA